LPQRLRHFSFMFDVSWSSSHRSGLQHGQKKPLRTPPASGMNAWWESLPTTVYEKALYKRHTNSWHWFAIGRCKQRWLSSPNITRMPGSEIHRLTHRDFPSCTKRSEGSERKSSDGASL